MHSVLHLVWKTHQATQYFNPGSCFSPPEAKTPLIFLRLQRTWDEALMTLVQSLEMKITAFVSILLTWLKSFLLFPVLPVSNLVEIVVEGLVRGECRPQDMAQRKGIQIRAQTWHLDRFLWPRHNVQCLLD